MFHNFNRNYFDFYWKDSLKYLILKSTSNRNNIQGVDVNIIKINTAYLKGPEKLCTLEFSTIEK